MGPAALFLYLLAPILPCSSKIDKPFFHFLCPPPVLLPQWSKMGAVFCCSEGAALCPGGREARHGSALGAGRQVQQGGEQGGYAPSQSPAGWWCDLWPRSRGNCCRSDALRGVGRGRGPEHTDLGPEAGRDIKRQGADFLSRSPVFLSPLARLPFLSRHFFIGHRQTPGGWFMVRGGPGRRPP